MSERFNCSCQNSTGATMGNLLRILQCKEEIFEDLSLDFESMR